MDIHTECRIGLALGAYFSKRADTRLSPRKKPDFDPATLNEEGVGGLLADAVLPDTVGGQRAGRALMLQRAMGEDGDFSLRYPQGSTLLSMLGGAGAGGLLGASLGNLYDMNLGNPNKYQLGLTHFGEVGGLTGAGVGAGVGALLSMALRNRAIKKVNQNYRDYQGTVTPVAEPLSWLGDFYSSGHVAGRAEALEALRTGTPRPEPQKVQTALEWAPALTGLALAPIDARAGSMVANMGGYASLFNRIRTIAQGGKAIDKEIQKGKSPDRKRAD